MIQYLVEHFALDVNLKNDSERTMLSWAAGEGNGKVID